MLKEDQIPEVEIPEDSESAELFSRDNDHYNHKFATKSFRFKRRIIIASVCALFAVLVGVGAAWAVTFLNESFDDEQDVSADLVATENFDDPFYMILVGTDTREAENSYQLTDGRSDSCMLVRVDPKNYVVTIISIPRDTKITYNGQTEKFNAAYNTGGISDTIKVVNKMFGIQVSHYAEISFNGLTDLVDSVGGVEVNVPTAINDPKSGVNVPAGLQTLNGEQALSFSRSRNFADGDFTRTADQRVLVEAMIQKAFKMDITQLPNVFNAAKKFIRTDFSIMQMYSLATQFKNHGDMKIYTSMVPSTTGMIAGASYCFCDDDALTRMMKLVENNEDPNFVEITSGASLGSSRDKAELDAAREKHFQEHPDCPGKASNSTSSSSSSLGSSSSNTYSYGSSEYNSSGSSSSGSNSTSGSSSSSSGTKKSSN